MKVTMIAALGRNGVIGVDGGLPWRLKGDLPRAKAMTMGHVLIMGRKTFESIGRPLPGRTTIVVTRQAGWEPSPPADTHHREEAPATVVHVASSVAAALKLAASIDDEVFVFGGAEIYAQTIDQTDRLELTEVDAAPDGDTYFPEIDWSAWREVAREHGDGFDWVTYIRASSAAG